LVEPACNPTQAVVWVSDDTIEGDAGGVTYNLGLQVSAVTDVKAKGNQVLVTVRKNDTGDCTKSVKETYAIEYHGVETPLSMNKK
jgi:hypothetical protein